MQVSRIEAVFLQIQKDRNWILTRRTLNLADYLSTHPKSLEGPDVKAELLWNQWFAVNCVISLNDDSQDNAVSSSRMKTAELKVRQIAW